MFDMNGSEVSHDRGRVLPYLFLWGYGLAD